MKTYLKTLAKEFKNHITRFISIAFIVLVSVGFCAGIGLAADKISYSLTEYYKTANVSDFIVKSPQSLSAEDKTAIKNAFPEADINYAYVVDADVEVEGEDRLSRLYFIDFDEWTVNLLSVDGKTFTPDKNFIFTDRADNVILGVKEGVQIELDFAKILKNAAERAHAQVTIPPLPSLKTTVTVGKTVQSPLTFAVNGEPSNYSFMDENGVVSEKIPDTTNGMDGVKDLLKHIFFIDKSAIPTLLTSYLGDTDAYIAVGKADRNIFDDFSANYSSFVGEGVKKLENAVDGARILTLNENYSFKSLHAYAEKVTFIGIILMVAFMLVTVLVVLSTMTRLIDEERGQIACLSTVGYSPFKIVFKYLLFALIATAVGGIAAYFVGLGVADLIFWVFNYSFAMPPMAARVAVVFYVITLAIVVFAALGATAIAGYKTARENCASLLRPRAPKAGRKVIIEKIPFIWNRLSFKYKSTVRNVLRYKSRFIMTVIAVAVSMALVMAGLTLLDICLFRGVDSVSIMIISLVIVFFAGLLTAVVIYTLTNINISERNRELATLKVLGYYDGEVAGYIYREIYIDTAVGIIFGFPLSALILMFLFNIMGTGTYATFMWAVAPVVVLLFTALVTLLLRRKIVKVDMNGSLKAVE